MAIPRKGSRQITVGGKQYRWYVRPRPTHVQGELGASLNVGVQGESPDGQVLLVATARFHPSAALTLQPEPVLPSEVARWIEAALSVGWVPEEPGPTFTLVAEPSDLSVEKVLEEVDSVGATVDFLHLWIPDELTLRGQSVTADAAMAVIVDRLLAHNLSSHGYVHRPYGRLYLYRRGAGSA